MKIAVVGSGAIGQGVAQLLAMAGYEVALLGTQEEHLSKSMQKIRWSLGKFVEKRKISKAHADVAFKRIKTTTSYEQACKETSFAIEAVPENIELKRKVFASLDSSAPSNAIFASTTSALSVTEMSKATKRPDKTAGMHFFNPPQQMALVEIVKGSQTSQKTTHALKSLAKQLGKTPIIVLKDVCGAVVNRILYAVFLDAFWTYQRGENTKEAIDAAIKYNGGFPMGWFELADFAGLDIVHEVGKNLYTAYSERFKPCLEVLEPLIKQQKFGKKTGFGFYDWTHGKPTIPPSLKHSFEIERSWVIAINEAAWLVFDDAASPKDIDTGMKLGTYWPAGPCQHADELGLDVTLNKLEVLYAKFKMEIYKPCPLLKEYVQKGWTGKKARRGFYPWNLN